MTPAPSVARPPRARSLGLAAALLGSCAPPEPDAPTPALAVHTPPEVLLVGCEAVLEGPACTLRPDATLSLWVAVHRNTRLALEHDGAPLPATWTAAEDGLRTELAPGERAGPLVLRDLDADWRYPLTLQPLAGPPPALQAIARRSEDGEHDAAEAALRARLPEWTGATRADALKLRGDNEYRRSNLAAAERAYELAFAAAQAEGLLRSASTVALTAVYLCIESLDDHACARRWLARHAELLAGQPDARVRHGYFAGLLADRTGDYRAAMQGFEQSARDARALGLAADLAQALLKLGAVYSRLGDPRRARQATAELLTLGDRLTPADRARALQSIAWIDLEARTRGDPAADPEPRFREALTIFSPGGADPDIFVAAEIQQNLAFAALLRGDPAAARAAIATLAPPNRRLHRWQLLLLGRIELAERRFADALRRFDELAATAAAADDLRLAWSSAVGAGEALEGLGLPERALERYRHATALHSLRLAALAVDAGRELFAAEGDRAARRLVHLLLRLERPAEAACAARQARAQAFAGLAAASRDRDALAAYQRDRAALEEEREATWQRPGRIGEQMRDRLKTKARRLDARLDAALSDQPPALAASASAPPRCDALRAPEPGELVLVYYPLEHGDAAFALDAHGVRGAELPAKHPTDPSARAERLLGPFAAEIDRATRIRVIASGAASREALHALPWSGAPLVEHAPVAYALDLPRAPAAPRPPRRAVQLAPPSNLLRAPAELDAVRDALAARGVVLERLTGAEPDLRARLGVDLLHYVGHANADGWASALDLGGDRRLSAGDLLGGDPPTVAVLGGCETGLPDPRAHAGGMSLAHALLLAGAAAVIATDANVDDDLAAALTPALIAALADGVEPAEALRQAQRARIGRGDWARFRAFIP